MSNQTSKDFIISLKRQEIKAKRKKIEIEKESTRLWQIEQKKKIEKTKQRKIEEDKLWKNVNLELNDGGSYIGGWQNGRFEGEGKRVYKNGDRFSCMFKSGIANGEGEYYSYLYGYVSKCNYKDGIKDGVDIIRYSNRRKEVNWVGGKRTGICTEYYNNGDIYAYSYKDGKIDSNDKGTYKCKNGKIYRGMKSEKTLSMWKCVGDFWKAPEAILSEIESNRTNFFGKMIMAPFILAGTAITTAAALTATGVAVVATPITGIVDSSSRYKNKIED